MQFQLPLGVALVTQGLCWRSHMVQMDRINLPQKQSLSLSPLHILPLFTFS